MVSKVYDFFVIGGGSAGLAASKEAAILGAKVALADFIVPTPIGTKWGLGGTCVNVGCIPKKLMHYAGLQYEELKDYEFLGHPDKLEVKHDWEKMVFHVQQHIKKTNWGYKNALRTNQVKYYNSYATLEDNNKIKLTDSKGEVEYVSAKNILVATGGRPNYNDIPGSKECCITSDDIFSLKKAPGKTLVVGASYIALECAGFLRGLGYDTTVMVRSILLRGFDQDMANRIGEYMERRETRFLKSATPNKFSKLDNGKVLVEFTQNGEEKKEEFDTVLLAIGRSVDSSKINADRIGLNIAKSGKLITNDADETNIPGIYALGDCAEGRPELTPPAIMAGKLLAHRLYKNSKKLMDYKSIATTVFTPLEFGSVGLSEEEAEKTLGKENTVVYHSEFIPTEWSYNILRGETCYCKVVCNKKENNKIVGMHIVCPNAGEVIQGFVSFVKYGLTKDQLDDVVAIHPTIAEEFTLLTAIKGIDDGKKTGCCG